MKKYLHKTFVKGIFAMLMTIVLINCFRLPVKARANGSGNFSTNYTLTGNGAEDLVRVAEAQIGKTGGELGYSSEEWCADFVLDCAIRANQTSVIPNDPNNANCNNLRVSIKGNYTTSSPQRGDICFWPNGTHVGIVAAVNGNIITTIEGNTENSNNSLSKVSKYTSRPLSTFKYIVRPNYQSTDVKPQVESSRFEYFNNGVRPVVEIENPSSISSVTFYLRFGTTAEWKSYTGTYNLDKAWYCEASYNDLNGAGFLACDVYIDGKDGSHKYVSMSNKNITNIKETRYEYFNGGIRPVVAVSNHSKVTNVTFYLRYGTTAKWESYPGRFNLADSWYCEASYSKLEGTGRLACDVYVDLSDGTHQYVSGFPIGVCKHTYDDGVITVEPTNTEKGEKTYTCTVCGETKTEVIDEVEKIDISHSVLTIGNTDYTYDGFAKEPSLTVKVGTKVLVANTDYTVLYSDNINAGTATITITGINSYAGSITKTFTINPAAQNINIMNSSLDVKESETAQIDADASGMLIYESSDTSVATVSSEGVVTGMSVGSAIIIIRTEGDGNHDNAETDVTIRVTHNYSSEITEAASCTENGIKTFICSGCGNKYTAEIVALGHNYEEETVEATCTERGYVTHSCSVCGDHYRDQYVDALRHTFDDGVITTPATDEAEGIKTYTCSRCGEKKTEIIPAITHTYDDGEIIQAATCTEPGVMLYKCTDCDKTYTVEIPALGHQYETTITDATCVKKGYTTHTCTECGDTYRDAYTNMKEHSYNSGEVIEEPACTEEGLKIYTCTVCNNQYTERIAEKGHQYETTVTPPTCTKKGYTTHTCSICKNSYRDTYTKEAEHSYNEGEIIEESTCVKEGMKVYTCDVCRNQYTEIISANGHLYEETVTAPDCTQKGYTTHKCSVCGDSYKDTYTDAKGHTWDAGEVSIEPGCETTGTKIYKCTVCNASRTEEVPPLGHEIVVDEAKAANCLESGFTDGIHCSRCGAVFKAQEEISAAGHHFSEWMIKEKATCTEKGKKEQICSICGKKETEVIKESGHDWNDGVITQKATEQANGVKTYNCKICGEVKTETMPAIKKDPASDDKPKSSTLAVGTIVSDANSGGYYKITSSATVEYQESINEYASNIKIPDVVVINGVSYQVTAIAPGVFKNNKKIVSISMGSNIKSIGDNAFSGCSRLQKVTIGKGVRTIGAKAFYKCKSLTKITIPAKVAGIGKQAFYGCRKLKGITIKTKKLTAQNVGSKAFKGIHREAGIKVPKTKLKVYKKLVKAKGAGKKVKIKK